MAGFLYIIGITYLFGLDYLVLNGSPVCGFAGLIGCAAEAARSQVRLRGGPNVTING